MFTLREMEGMFSQTYPPDSCFVTMFDQAPVAAVVIDASGYVEACNHLAARFWQTDTTGKDKDLSHTNISFGLAGVNTPVMFANWFEISEHDTVIAWYKRIFREEKTQIIESRLVTDEKLVRLIGQPIKGCSELAQVTILDLSFQLDDTSTLGKAAYYDQLTGLPNRYLLLDRLNWAIRNAHRQKENMAVLALDLDDFKNINDTYGHQAGDRLLQAVGRRMARCLRESDTIARQGGDEFTVLMQNVTDKDSINLIAERLLACVNKPVLIKDVLHKISASIGICLYPQDAKTAEDLLEKSDLALYRAKARGKNQYVFYQDDMKLAADDQALFRQHLRKAFINKELELFYQPIVAAKDRQLLALEALIRWNSKKDGILPASLFLPVAKAIGIDTQFSDWALQTAFVQMKGWLDDGTIKENDPCRLAVNLSSDQLKEVDLAEKIIASLAESGLPPERLILEIHESALYDCDLSVRLNLQKLHKQSVVLHLDDFRDGFYTMDQINQIPFGSLKIEQSLTGSLVSTEEGQLILATIIRLAHLLGLEVVAEGVETKEAAQILTQNGCDALQGYWISRPLPADQILSKLYRLAQE